jgi:Flp pilus assembly protein TadD
MAVVETSSRSRLLIAIVLCSVALGGCAARQTSTADPGRTGTLTASPSGMLRSEVEEWSRRFEASPKDKSTIIGYAQALRANDQTAEAVAVLQKGMLSFQQDFEIASAYGKALAANGDFDTALKVIRGANSVTSPDWRLLSAEAAILDQTGNPSESRRIYATALKIAPDEPILLNNLGLSYLLTNETALAEKTLRRAAASPNADSRIRQNLMLSLGLQGKFQEAEKVARTELSPEQADSNLAYLRDMLAQQNSWRAIQQADSEKPGQPRT